MDRAPAPDEAYVRKGRVLPMGGGSRLAGNPSTTFSQVQITPVYDTCAQCGYRIRRGNIKLTLT